MAKSGSKLAETSQNRIKYFKFDFILSTWLKLKWFNYIMRVMRKFLEFCENVKNQTQRSFYWILWDKENSRRREHSLLCHILQIWMSPSGTGRGGRVDGWTVDHGVVVRIRGWNICSCRKSVTEIGRLETYIGNIVDKIRLETKLLDYKIIRKQK